MQLLYQDAVAGFSLGELAAQLGGELESAINACVECCDRYSDTDRIALHCEAADGHSERITFTELRQRAARFAKSDVHGVRCEGH